MRATVQRVTSASVSVDGEVVGSIGAGALVLLGISHEDTVSSLEKMVNKLLNTRFFSDSDGKTNLSILDAGGEILLISQFTLYADLSSGRRPSFTNAARPEQAVPLYESCIRELEQGGVRVQTGRFGAHMVVSLVNDGPFTLNFDTDTF